MSLSSAMRSGSSSKTMFLDYAEDNEFAARAALVDFEFRGRRPFQDAWERSFDEYTFRFIWCLYAIVWTIREYDSLRAARRARDGELRQRIEADFEKNP
jgi:hypothetical protein